MIKNITIAVLIIIIISTVFYAQSQALEALSVKEQLEIQLKQEQKKSEEQRAVAEDIMERMLEQKFLSDSLQLELNNCK